MNRYVKILLWGSMIWYFGEGMLGPLLVVFAQKIGGDLLEITSASAIYLIVSGVLMVLVGKVSDHWSKEWMMMTGYGLNALLTFFYIFVDSPMELFFVQAGLGIASALATPTWDALYGKYLEDSKDGYGWGIADGVPKIVTGVALFFGGALLNSQSFTYLFIVMGTIQTVALVVQLFIFTHKPDLSR